MAYAVAMQSEAVSPLQQGAVVAIVLVGCMLGAALLILVLLRVARKEAAKSTRQVVDSPWNDLSALDKATARIGGVVSTDDEMLVELVWVAPPKGAAMDESGRWLVGPASPAGIISLGKWHDDDTVVTVVVGPGGVLLYSTGARAHLRAARTTTVTLE